MRSNKQLLLGTSLGTLLLLGTAISQEHFRQEWREIQWAYQSRLPEGNRADFSIQLRQIVVPVLHVTDRCVSCHVGMAAGERPIEGDPVLGSHPRVAHDPGEYGCTICHGGQGRATTKADAHGQAEFWPAPMLGAGHSYAGCGSCHTHLAVPNATQLERGRLLFERFDCLRCHAVDGRGGTLRPLEAAAPQSPDLSWEGLRGFQASWYEAHLAKSRQDGASPWKTSFREIASGDLAALNVFLSSRVGAPGLVESKALFHSLGCRGCHMLGGAGGDDGPELNRVGLKDPGRLDFSFLDGERDLAAWLAEHFRAPAKLVPGSQMPILGLSEAEIEQLTFYVLSLRRTEFPQAYWPRDRVLAEHLDQREFAQDGATLYGTFCAACHGRQGEGKRYPGMSPFPAIGTPDFLTLASDEFIEQTVRRGRPGRRMPAWGEKEGGLRGEEIQAIVGYVRSLGRGVQPALDPSPRRFRARATPGRTVYEQNCSQCHGPEGKGGEGPALNNRVLLETASDTFLVETIQRGRAGTNMPAFGTASTIHRMLSPEEIQAVVAFLRTWEVQPQ